MASVLRDDRSGGLDPESLYTRQNCIGTYGVESSPWMQLMRNILRRWELWEGLQRVLSMTAHR